jgi:hypothetical protein
VTFAAYLDNMKFALSLGGAEREKLLNYPTETERPQIKT